MKCQWSTQYMLGSLPNVHFWILSSHFAFNRAHTVHCVGRVVRAFILPLGHLTAPQVSKPYQLPPVGGISLAPFKMDLDLS